MPVLRSHVDDFTLLRLAVGDVTDDERFGATSHLETCKTCQDAFEEMKEVNRGLKRLASEGLLADFEANDLPDGDPFRRRPRLVDGRRPGRERIPPEAVSLASAAIVLRRRLLDSVADGTIATTIKGLDLGEPVQRLALLYGLQEAGRQITMDPLRASEFGAAAIRRLRLMPRSRAPAGGANLIAPWELLWGQAHLLAAQAGLWTKEFDRAARFLRVAYRAFGSIGDETSLAHTELVEAQRRSFVSEGKGALILSARARATFERYGLEDLAACAMAAEGIAQFDVGNPEGSVLAFRKALPVFDRHGIWNAYISALNCLGTALTSLGRLDEARREYAMALRRFTLAEHKSLQGYLRLGLAQIVLSAGRYHAAALSAAAASRLFAACGMQVNALIATLLEIESWARHGDVDRARRRLDGLTAATSRGSGIDRALKRQLSDALSGGNPDFDQLQHLRAQLRFEIVTVPSAR